MVLCIVYVCFSMLQTRRENFSDDNIDTALTVKNKLPGYLSGVRSLKYNGTNCRMNSDNNILCDGANETPNFKLLFRGATDENKIMGTSIVDAYAFTSNENEGAFCRVSHVDGLFECTKGSTKQNFIFEEASDEYNIKNGDGYFYINGAGKIDTANSPTTAFTIE